MEPAYHSWQLAVIDKHSENYTNGDVVAFWCSELDSVLIKRIVGSPGDSVKIINGVLYINGEPTKVYESYISYAGIAEKTIFLKEGEYFVMGDNYEYSKDSRYANIGTINKNQIYGKILPNVSLKE